MSGLSLSLMEWQKVIELSHCDFLLKQFRYLNSCGCVDSYLETLIHGLLPIFPLLNQYREVFLILPFQNTRTRNVPRNRQRITLQKHSWYRACAYVDVVDELLKSIFYMHASVHFAPLSSQPKFPFILTPFLDHRALS